jgi:flagellar hook-associated protein 3 FlgL
MTRIATYGNHQSALLDLMASQQAKADAQNRIASKKNAVDLSGFGRDAETVSALRSASDRVQGFIDAGETVAGRLSMQDLAFDRLSQGSTGARQAIAEAVGAGRAEGLMQTLEGLFSTTLDGLNLQHQGRYLFSGGIVDAAPVGVRTLAELSAAPSAASVFSNGALRQASRLDEATVLETGFLADEVAGELFDIFRDIQQFHEATPLSGPLSGPLDPATVDFLTQQMARLEQASQSLIAHQARNGAMQARVDDHLAAHEDRKITLDGLLADRTDADMLKAASDLQLADIAIQATASMIAGLKETSLLNYLR